MPTGAPLPPCGQTFARRRAHLSPLAGAPVPGPTLTMMSNHNNQCLMKHLALSFSVACMLAIGTPAAAQSYAELADQALEAIARDSLEQAERLIRLALKTDPANQHNALLFSNLATIQRAQGRYEQALENYTFALNMMPEAVPILLNRATLYMEMGRDRHALADYTLVLDLQPHNREALLMRAYLRMQARQYKEAHADYDTLLRVAPGDFKARLGLATLLQDEGKRQEALSLLDKMIAEQGVQPDSADVADCALLYTARAGVYQGLGQAEAALLDLEEAVRLDPALPDVYLMRSRLYLSQGKKREARQDVEKAIELGVPVSEVYDLLQQCR